MVEACSCEEKNLIHNLEKVIKIEFYTSMHNLCKHVKNHFAKNKELLLLKGGIIFIMTFRNRLKVFKTFLERKY